MRNYVVAGLAAELMMTGALIAIAAVLTVAPANADPEPPLPPPPAPGIAVPNLTPGQQCAWIAFSTWIPCNWVMSNPPPPGTPGTLYGQ